MSASTPLPAAFDSANETDKFLRRMKDRAAKKFAFTRVASMDDASSLAFWLFVFGRTSEALQVCQFLGTYQFAGRYDLWVDVEWALALESRLLRAAGKYAAAKKCVDRIKAVGVTPMRLRGELLIGKGGAAGYLDQVKYCLEEDNLARAREWRLQAVQELCLLIELGGSKKWTTAKGEKELQSQLDVLRAELKIPAAGR